MRIGIITLYGMCNYGNRLQQYALIKFLRNNGYECISLVDNNSKLNKVMLYKPLAYAYYRIMHKNREYPRYKLFKSFDKKHGIRSFLVKNNPPDDIDIYVIGSDQVWNPSYAGTAFYFASFSNRKHKIAYAASFSVDKLPENKRMYYKKKLLDLDFISVREEKGAEIVKNLIGYTSPVVVDPTLLLEIDEWEKCEEKPLIDIPSDYILTYFIGTVSEFAENNIKEYAEKNKLSILRLEAKHTNILWEHTGPAEFLWLIHHCKMLFTDSFHGTLFSLIFERISYVFNRSDQTQMMSRLETLLDKFGQKNRIVSENVIPTSVMQSISDYYITKVKELRIQSQNYLLKALDDTLKKEVP